jgi:hypothetical protein
MDVFCQLVFLMVGEAAVHKFFVPRDLYCSSVHLLFEDSSELPTLAFVNVALNAMLNFKKEALISCAHESLA